MSVLVLKAEEIAELLPVAECIDVMAEALGALARGEAYQPLRTIVRPPGATGLMGLMPSYRGDSAARLFGLKAVCVFPGNAALGRDAHQGAVLLFSGETGELLAVLSASAITAIRTAAVSGLATRLLAREDASDLAIVGAGAQARAHLAAMAAVRGLRRARVASRRPERAAAFADDVRRRYSFAVDAAPDIEAAVRGADIVVTVTTASEPILRRSWIAEGAHVNAVGASVPTSRELDAETLSNARLFVDRRESTVAEAGDFVLARNEGAIGPEHIQAEIGEVVVGSRPGRRSRAEITVFKSVGLAIEDLAAAQRAYMRARERGVGAQVEV